MPRKRRQHCFYHRR